MKRQIILFNFVERSYRIPGYSGFEAVPDETPGSALVRVVGFLGQSHLGHFIVQIVPLPNPIDAGHPNFAFLVDSPA